MPKMIDLTGQKFNHLLVLRTYTENGRTWCDYLCDCGNVGKMFSYSISKEICISCGCSHYDDISSSRFGRLVVHSRDPNDRRKWICVCDCGIEKSIFRSSLTSGETKSCGCLRKELSHRGRKRIYVTKLYQTYNHMMTRCFNMQDPHYERYGGRGIVISDEWRGPLGRDAFYEWAFANGFEDDPNLSIDRIDNNGPYAPWNCRWIPMEEQAKNKRNNIWFEYKGDRLILADLVAKYSTVPYKEVHRRLTRNWNLEDALLRPRRKRINGSYQ